MKNTQLFDLLGEIDNKFLDEALGGDSEKPLKIDTSRGPVRWYHIAAPIAACLVLGAGVAAALRFRGDSVSTTPGSGESISTNVTISDPPKDQSSDPIIIEVPEEKIDYYAKFPIFAAENIPTHNNTHGEINEEDIVNATLSVTKCGEYDVCVSAETVFFLEEQPDTVYAAAVYMSLVKDGKQISSDGFSWVSAVTSDRACYAFDTDLSNISVELLELTDANVAAVRYRKAATDEYDTECELLSIKDDKISRMYGTDVTGGSPTPAASFSETLLPDGNSIIDIGRNREYRCSVDAFNSDPYETPHFSTHFINIKGDVVNQSSYNGPSNTELHTRTTIQDLNNWKDFINDADVYRIEIELFSESKKSDLLSSEQASAVMDMLASAELEATDDPEWSAGNDLSIYLYDARNNCIASIAVNSILSVDYGSSGDRYVFDFKNDYDVLRQKLIDLISPVSETSQSVLTKSIGDYTVDLITEIGAENDEIYYDTSKAVFEVSRGGESIRKINLPASDSKQTDVNVFSSVILTFEMKDGVGFAICPLRDEDSPRCKHASFFKLDGDEVTALYSPNDYARLDTGTDMYIGTDPQIVSEENSIATDDGNKLVIDFQNNLISVVEN